MRFRINEFTPGDDTGGKPLPYYVEQPTPCAARAYALQYCHGDYDGEPWHELHAGHEWEIDGIHDARLTVVLVGDTAPHEPDGKGMISKSGIIATMSPTERQLIRDYEVLGSKIDLAQSDLNIAERAYERGTGDLEAVGAAYQSLFLLKRERTTTWHTICDHLDRVQQKLVTTLYPITPYDEIHKELNQ